MAGEITETGELYSPYVGLVYMFNLIVGTGALTMPKAFATAGWLVSLILLVFVGFMSFVTTTFAMEAMAAANAQLRWKRMEIHKEEDDEDSSTASDSDLLSQDNYERAEKRPILSVQRRSSASLFEITERVEMGQMASMFFNKVGVNLFYFCIITYLYGDLAIYAAAVPVSLMQVTCALLHPSEGTFARHLFPSVPPYSKLELCCVLECPRIQGAVQNLPRMWDPLPPLAPASLPLSISRSGWAGQQPLNAVPTSVVPATWKTDRRPYTGLPVQRLPRRPRPTVGQVRRAIQ
ncbi:transmembrane protein 104 (predicted), isoform CRA_b [Rattus norvegicus]|uniref:Transmembrane protein 104 (Predicted), isoform CRA_b n=1 Tax=Rattus norvegicus TaxID=10116 RepID=A6HKL0_RAT|nr:transmembrane protein 104 (predicted), isoform CRA_b [Rattus norvegicus]